MYGVKPIYAEAMEAIFNYISYNAAIHPQLYTQKVGVNLLAFNLLQLSIYLFDHKNFSKIISCKRSLAGAIIL
jgi:hypothetical protein